MYPTFDAASRVRLTLPSVASSGFGASGHKSHTQNNTKPGIERVQTLADISRSAICCRSNESRAPVANPPNSAQLEGNLYHDSPKLYPGPCSSVGMWRGTDRQTDTHTYGRDEYTFRLGCPHAKCNEYSG